MSLHESLKRTQKIASDVRRLSAFDGHSSPPDWRPFVSELADELAIVIVELIATQTMPIKGREVRKPDRRAASRRRDDKRKSRLR